MAVAYHMFNDFATAPDTIADIRKTYDGPLTLADDLLVWNINKAGIKVRQVVGPEDARPAKPPTPAGPPNPSERTPRSNWLDAGRIDLLD